MGIEEERFAATVDAGMEMLNDLISDVKTAGKTVLPGAEVFKLGDTFGFPIDLTREIAADAGMTLDEEGYQELLTAQKERARGARAALGDFGWAGESFDFLEGIGATEFTGYSELSSKAAVVEIIDAESSEAVGTLSEGKAIVILDRTPFYAEGGGQVGDTGVIKTDGAELKVLDTKKHDGVYMHICEVVSGTLKVGDAADASVDAARRAAIKRNHSSVHMLQAALRARLGNHVEQAGQFVNEKEVRFDFTHFSAMSAEEIKTVENIVNEEILKSAQVTMTEMPIEEAKKLGAMALFGEKYGDIVRVVKAGDISVEFCGGTHVSNTSKLGLFKILSESSVASGVRRIEAVTGKGVLELIENNTAVLYGVAKAMKMDNVGGIEKRAASLMNEVRMKDKEIEKLSGELSAIKAASMSDSAETAGQFKFVSGVFENVPSEELRTMCDKAKQSDEAVVMIVASKNTEKQTVSFAVACTPSAVKLGANAGNIVREAAKTAGGNGGGRPDTAMAGGKDVTKTDDAIAKAKEIVASI